MTDILEIKLEGVEQLASASQNLNKTVESIVRLQEQLKDLAEKQYSRQVAAAAAREKAAEAREAGRPERDRKKQEREEEKRIRAEERKAREEKKRLLKDESEALKKEREAKKYFESLQRQSMLGRKPPTDPGASLSALYRPTPPGQPEQVSEVEEERIEETKKAGSSMKFFTSAIKMAWDGMKKFINILERIAGWWTKTVFAITALSEKLVHDMQLSRSLGTDVQTPKYLKATMGQLVDTDKLLQGLATLRQDPTNVFYNYFKQERGLTGNEPMDIQAVEATKFIQNIAKANAGNLAQAYRMYGIGDTGVSMEEFKRLGQVPKSETETLAKQYEERKKSVGPETEKNVRDFVRRFELGLLDIETMFTGAMTKNFGSLEKLGGTLLNIVKTLTSDEVFPKLVNQITDTINRIATAFGTKENLEGIASWISRITVLGEKMINAIEPLIEGFLRLYKAIDWITTKLGIVSEKNEEFNKFLEEGKKSSSESAKGYREYIESKQGNGIAKAIDEMVPSADDFYKSLIGYLGIGGAPSAPSAEKMSYGKAERESDMLLKVLSRLANQRQQGVRVEFSHPQASSNINVQLNRVPGAAGGAPFGGSGFNSGTVSYA